MRILIRLIVNLTLHLTLNTFLSVQLFAGFQRWKILQFPNLYTYIYHYDRDISYQTANISRKVGLSATYILFTRMHFSWKIEILRKNLSHIIYDRVTRHIQPAFNCNL